MMPLARLGGKIGLIRLNLYIHVTPKRRSSFEEQFCLLIVGPNFGVQIPERVDEGELAWQNQPALWSTGDEA